MKEVYNKGNILIKYGGLIKEKQYKMTLQLPVTTSEFVTDVFKTNNFNINSAVGQTYINKRYNLDSRVATIAFTYRI